MRMEFTFSYPEFRAHYQAGIPPPRFSALGMFDQNPENPQSRRLLVDGRILRLFGLKNVFGPRNFCQLSRLVDNSRRIEEHTVFRDDVVTCEADWFDDALDRPYSLNRCFENGSIHRPAALMQHEDSTFHKSRLSEVWLK